MADLLVETDREYLLGLLLRLALAAEEQDMETIMAALDLDLRPLREEAERVLKQVRPTEVRIMKLDVSVDPAKKPLHATAVMIVRVTGDVIEKGSQRTVLAGVTVLLHKTDGKWLIKDAEVEKVKPGHDPWVVRAVSTTATHALRQRLRQALEWPRGRPVDWRYNPAVSKTP